MNHELRPWPETEKLALLGGDRDEHETRGHPARPMSAAPLPPQRLSLASDAPLVSELMRASVLELFPHFYDQLQTASAAVHIAHLDMKLIEDGTYYAHEAGDEIVCLRRLEQTQQALHGGGCGRR